MKSYYIVKPHFVGITEKQLRYIDVLTYLTIRSYYNYESHDCYPSYETIAEKMGVSKSFVMDSTSRLIKAGYINKKRRYNNSNVYTFKGASLADKIPVEVLSLNLSIYEKAMLVLLRQCCEGTRVDIFINMANIAARLGISHKIVYTQIKLLIDKGLVEEKVKRKTKIVTGYRLTSVIDWAYDTDYQARTIEKEEYVLMIV